MEQTSWTRFSNLALKSRKFAQPQFRHGFVKSVDAWILTPGSGERTNRAVKLAELVSSVDHPGADNVMMLRPTVACLAMLDVKTADPKDDSEGEFDLVLAQGF